MLGVGPCVGVVDVEQEVESCVLDTLAETFYILDVLAHVLISIL